MFTSILNNIKVIVLATILAVGASYAYAQTWTGPTATPPAGNTPAPVNVGSEAQVKAGGLGVASLISNTFLKAKVIDVPVGQSTNVNGTQLQGEPGLKIAYYTYNGQQIPVRAGYVLTADGNGYARWLPVASTGSETVNTYTISIAGRNTQPVYFGGGVDMPAGTYRIAYKNGFFSWDSGSHFAFYFPNYSGRPGFYVVTNNTASKAMPLVLEGGGVYYTSENALINQFSDKYFEFTHSGNAPIGLRFDDNVSDNTNTSVQFGLTKVN